MARLNDTRYGLLGYVVWQGGKWYLRRRMPSKRTLALAGAGALGTLTAGAALARRLTG
ncbi:MAG: hypothetical protein JWN10_760 [Solirubrobacterales bacterium]|nr:hypothetical protein [Solirubrobacterales bacterium]